MSMQEAETRTLEVTQADIDNGTHSALICPFALAARRLFPGWHSVTVVTDIELSQRDNDYRAHEVWNIEPRGQEVIGVYDKTGEMEPGSYTLTLNVRRGGTDMSERKTPAEQCVSEEPYEFAGHQWSFRRGTDEQEKPRWQVFRDDAFSPVGFVRAVYQPDQTVSNDGWQLAVEDSCGRPVGERGKRDAPGTVPAVNYPRQALAWIRARMEGIA